MPISRMTPKDDQDLDRELSVFHVQESFEVYDGALALAIDHLLNHIKALISLAYIPGGPDLEAAFKRHPLLRRMLKKGVFYEEESGGRSPDRVLLNECQRLLESTLEIAHLAAWPETQDEARAELEALRKQVPFLDYRYENDPYPSDKDHEDQV